MNTAELIGRTEDDALSIVRATGAPCRVVRLQNRKQARADTFVVVRARCEDGGYELVVTPFIVGSGSCGS